MMMQLWCLVLNLWTILLPACADHYAYVTWWPHQCWESSYIYPNWHQTNSNVGMHHVLGNKKTAKSRKTTVWLFAGSDVGWVFPSSAQLSCALEVRGLQYLTLSTIQFRKTLSLPLKRVKYHLSLLLINYLFILFVYLFLTTCILLMYCCCY